MINQQIYPYIIQELGGKNYPFLQKKFKNFKKEEISRVYVGFLLGL